MARQFDAATAHAIMSLRPSISHEQACGGTPINGLLHLAAQRGLLVERLDLRNSGDTAGDRERVVGYGAFAFFEPHDKRRPH
jgi:AmmeMemoRadiSam system protein B